MEGKKREDDRLSSLPDDLIHKILSFIDIKHAIQTSALSSRWRFIWTSMPYLNFSREPCANLSELVKCVFSNHNILTAVRSVNLNFKIQREFELLFKQIFFSTLNLPALNTLYLHDICISGVKPFAFIISKCGNLKNLTLKKCRARAYSREGLTICVPQLSSLTLDYVYGDVKGFNIDAPQLRNLTIRDLCLRDLQCLMISAPDLELFDYKGYKCLPLSTDDFLSLEKADICVYGPTDARQVLRLLQQLHNVKSLTLNLDIVELLSTSVELMSRQSCPFANLKSLNFHAVSNASKKRIKMSAEVKSYLLDSSPGANFAMVSREIEKAITELRALLEHEKASTETKMAKMHEEGKELVDIDRCWEHMSLQINEGKEKVTDINSKLKEIKELLGELTALNAAIIQPSFCTLYAEACIVMKRIVYCIMMGWEKNQRRLSECFNQLATTLLPSSY